MPQYEHVHWYKPIGKKLVLKCIYTTSQKLHPESVVRLHGVPKRKFVSGLVVADFT